MAFAFWVNCFRSTAGTQAFALRAASPPTSSSIASKTLPKAVHESG